jgi:murein DD-endopeptidase MepM/ murein hydrolase activator NlpD
MAISPTISLGRVSKTTSNLRSTVSQTGKTTNAIKNTLIGSVSKKRNLWNSTKIFRTKRDEFERRQSQKDLLFAPSILRRRGGARLLSQQDSSTSITDRLLGFVKYLTAGWLIGNLPSFIFLGEQFVSRLGTAGAIMSNYGDETLKVMKSIGSIFKSALKNLSAFDFSDRSGLMQSSITELTDALDDLGTGLSDALGVLFAPFKQLPTEPKDEPTPTTPTPPGSPAPTPPGTPTPTGGNSDYWTLVAITALEESDPQGRADVAQSIYNRAAAGVFPGGKNIRNIILAGNGGQYQPVERAVKEFHQIGDRESAIKAIMVADKVSRKTAEQMIDNTASAINNPTLRKNAAEFIENRTDFRGKNLKVDKPSSTLPRRRTPNDNIFGNFVGPASYAYGQKTSGRPSPVPNLGVTQTPTPVPTPQTRVPPPPSGQRKLQKLDIFTKSLGKDVDFIEIGDVYLGRGGQHKGIDIRAPLGTYISLRADAEWVAYDFQPGGYGHVLDVWVPSYGVQLRFGHLIEKPAKLSKIPAGTSFARVGSSGNSSGPHIHFEYDTQKGASRGGGAGDPDRYVRLLLLTKSPNKGKFSPAPKPSAPLVPVSPQIPVEQEEAVEIQNTAYQLGLREGIVQERRGQKIVIIDDRGIQIPQKVMTSSGDTLSIQIDESALLNTFMKNKLLLDLNYV